MTSLGLGEDAHDVFFAHDEQLFAVDLDGLAGVLAEENAVADLDVESDDAAGFVALDRTDGDHLALVGLFTRGIGNDDAEGGGRFSSKTLDDDAVMQRTDLHLLFSK